MVKNGQMLKSWVFVFDVFMTFFQVLPSVSQCDLVNFAHLGGHLYHFEKAILTFFKSDFSDLLTPHKVVWQCFYDFAINLFIFTHYFFGPFLNQILHCVLHYLNISVQNSQNTIEGKLYYLQFFY